MTPEVLDLIDKVVDEKIANNEMFTAFDVSLDVKSKCRAQNLPIFRHSEMRQEIHQAVQVFVANGNYEIVLKDVGAPRPANLYYPQGTDPDSYTPRKRDDNPTNLNVYDPATGNVQTTGGVAVSSSSFLPCFIVSITQKGLPEAAV